MSRRSKKSPFRSTFEEDVAKILQEFNYEPFTIPYTISRSYRPDFVDASGLYLIECKGYFRDGDTKKYTSIRDSLPEGQELIFVLMQPINSCPFLFVVTFHVAGRYNTGVHCFNLWPPRGGQVPGGKQGRYRQGGGYIR